MALRATAVVLTILVFGSGNHWPVAAALIVATGADPAGLGRLLRYLEAIGVAETAGTGQRRLTNLGREPEDEHTAAPLRLDRAPARRELGGALSLLSAVRTGRGDHATWFGAEHAEHVLNESALLASRMDEEAEEAAYLAGALAAAEPLAGLRSIEITGRAVFADALVKAHSALRATVVAAAQETAVFRSRHDVSGHLTYKTESVMDELLDPRLDGRTRIRGRPDRIRTHRRRPEITRVLHGPVHEGGLRRPGPSNNRLGLHPLHPQAVRTPTA